MPGSRKDRSGAGKYPCIVCNQQVTIHQKALQCDNCDEWTHFKCTPLTCNEYSDLAKSSQDWYCGNCEHITEGQGQGQRSRGPRSTARGDPAGDSGGGGDRSVLSSDSSDDESEAARRSRDPADVMTSRRENGHEEDDTSGIRHVVPSEELLVLLEDDFIKNLGNLVDILKLKFEKIHQMESKYKQLEHENFELKRKLSAREDEVLHLKNALNSHANVQEEIKRLNNVIKGLRDSVNVRTDDQEAQEAENENALKDRQGRMATVLGRMTNFLSGLSSDLTKSDIGLSQQLAEESGSQTPVSQRSRVNTPDPDRPKAKKAKRA